MEDYRIATISDRIQMEISELERQLKQDTGRDFVLIAYEPQREAH